MSLYKSKVMTISKQAVMQKNFVLRLNC